MTIRLWFRYLSETAALFFVVSIIAGTVFQAIGLADYSRSFEVDKLRQAQPLVAQLWQIVKPQSAPVTVKSVVPVKPARAASPRGPFYVAGLQSFAWLVVASFILTYALSTAGSSRRTSLKLVYVNRWWRLVVDCAICIAFAAGWFVFALSLYSCFNVVIPIMQVWFATSLGVLVYHIHQREQELCKTLKEQLELMQNHCEAEMLMQESDSKLSEAICDRQIRREFIESINHDLKAPLSVMSWNLSKLQTDGLYSPSAPDKIDRIVRTVDRLFDLIAELTRTYCDKEFVSRNSSSNLNEVLMEAVRLATAESEKKGSTVCLELFDNEASVECNKIALARVIDNLILNALKHNKPGVRVTVSAKEAELYHIVQVSDNGKGIEPGDLSRIFQSRYQAEPSCSDGQGLGLSIVKALVEDTGGEVSVVSRVGVGTTFSVALPKGKTEVSGEVLERSPEFAKQRELLVSSKS